MNAATGGNVGSRQDFGMLLNLAGVVFLDELTDHLLAAGYDGFSTRTGWVIRSVGAEPVSLRDLADRMGLSSPGTLKAIEPMIEHGYLERIKTDDRRVRAVAVTERGRQALAVAKSFHVDFEASIAASVGAEAAAAVREVLESLVHRGSRHIPQLLVTQRPYS